MKNKKGFTLIEIIVCLVLITGIGTLVVVNLFKGDNKEEERGKVISSIVTSVETYLALNNKEIMEYIKNNVELNEQWGYKVLYLSELKDIGLLDINLLDPVKNKDFTLITENDESNIDLFRDYSRIVIYYDKNSGLLDIIYPFQYYNLGSDISNLDDLYLENGELKKISCDTGLNKDKLKFFNKNYELQHILNIKCSNLIAENSSCNENMSDEEKLLPEDLDEKKHTYISCYKFDEENIIDKEYYRKIVIKPKFDYFLENNLQEKIEENQENVQWISSNEIKIVSGDNFDRNIEYSLTNADKNSSLLTDNYEGYIIKIKENSTSEFEIKSKITGFINKEYSYEISKKYKIGLDNEEPTINCEVENDKYKCSFEDTLSGIKTIKINGEDINAYSWEGLADNSYALHVEDKAGNYNDEVLPNLENIIDVNVNPIENSLDKFEFEISSNSNNIKIKEIRTQASVSNNEYDSNFIEGDLCQKKTLENISEYNFTIGLVSDSNNSDGNLSNIFDKVVDDFAVDNLINNFGIKYYIKVFYEYEGIELSNVFGFDLNLNFKVESLQVNNDKNKSDSLFYTEKTDLSGDCGSRDQRNDYAHCNTSYLEGINSNGDLLFSTNFEDFGKTYLLMYKKIDNKIYSVKYLYYDTSPLQKCNEYYGYQLEDFDNENITILYTKKCGTYQNKIEKKRYTYDIRNNETEVENINNINHYTGYKGLDFDNYSNYRYYLSENSKTIIHTYLNKININKPCAGICKGTKRCSQFNLYYFNGMDKLFEFDIDDNKYEKYIFIENEKYYCEKKDESNFRDDYDADELALLKYNLTPTVVSH